MEALSGVLLGQVPGGLLIASSSSRSLLASSVRVGRHGDSAEQVGRFRAGCHDLLAGHQVGARVERDGTLSTGAAGVQAADRQGVRRECDRSAACRQGTLRSLAGEMLAAPRGGSLQRADARRTAGGLTIRAERPGTFPGTRGVPTASIAAAPRKISAPTRTIHDQSRMLLQPIATPPAMVPRTTVTNNRTYCPIISASPYIQHRTPSSSRSGEFRA